MIKKILKRFPKTYQFAKELRLKCYKRFPKAYEFAKTVRRKSNQFAWAVRLKYCRVMSNARYFAYPVSPRVRTKLDTRVIITLTSYPPRFDTLHLTLKNLLTQDVASYQVILWLYKADFEVLPDAIKHLEKNPMFSIRLCEEDIKSYKKLIPALQEYAEYFLVTADDDAYYPTTWLRTLINGYDDTVKAVVGMRGHMIAVDENNTILPYKQWQGNIDATTLDKKVFLTGLGGILYPPHCFDKEVFNQANFMSVCDKTDDIWFFYMLHRNGFICKKIGKAFPDIVWENSQKTALFLENVHNFGNDKAITAMTEIYGSPL